MPVERFIALATTEGRRVLDVIFRHASEAVTVQEVSGRLLYANDAAAALVGYTSGEEMLAAPVEDLINRFEIIDESGEPMPLTALPGRRVLSGEPFVEEVVGYRRRGSTDVRWSRVRASPVKNNAGEVILAINYFLDTTEAREEEERRRLLTTAYEALGLSLDSRTSLTALAEVIVPALGEWCLVHLIEGDHLVLAASASMDPETTVALVEMGQQESIALDADRVQVRVAKSRQHQLVNRVTPHLLEEAKERFGEDFAALVQSLNLHAALCVPLAVRDHAVGTITVARSEGGPPYDPDDVELLLGIADRAATTIENARLYEREHEIANTLQQGLAAQRLPEIPGIELAARYRPLGHLSDVGGDFYDALEVGDRWVFFVGDIAGKGIKAAAAVGLARFTVRATALLDSEPATVLPHLNAALRTEDPERMCTLAYAVLEPGASGWTMRVSLAGHPPPLLLRGSESTFLGQPSPPAGLFDSLDVTEETHDLVPGDLVVMYTDGYSLANLAPPESVELGLGDGAFSTAEAALDSLLKRLEAEPTIRDDVVLLALRIL